jgi:Tol biopolymer transport system component
MKKIILYIALCLSTSAFAQEKKTIVDDAGTQVKIAMAKQKFYGGDYRSALNIYKELAAGNPNDGSIAFYIGECYYAMDQVPEALEQLEKAKTLTNPHSDLPLLLGRIYQSKGDIDKALTEYNAFRSAVASSPGKLKESDIDFLVAQCNTAKELMAKPVNVKITNLGELVNSQYNDKKPTLSMDGRMLIFTSGRPETKGGKIDKEGGNVYFDDIYVCMWDSVNNKWGEPDVLRGAVNSEGHDACTSLSPDGKQLFVYLNTEEGGSTGAGDIYVSKVSASGKWSAPKKLDKKNVNTSYYEDAACLSPDGKKLYFVSERPKGGFGHGDIWVSERIGKSEWGPPVNLGPTVNTDRDENAIYMHPDGKTLFFSSEGHGSMGEHDLFKTVYENGQWSKPVNLGYPINSVKQDKSFILSADNKIAYFVSNREGGIGGDDIYLADMQDYAVQNKDNKVKATGPFNTTIKGRIINADGTQAVTAKITLVDADGKEIANTTSKDGEFSIEIMGGKQVTAKVEADGFKTLEEKFEIKLSKDDPGVQAKDFILYKK